MNADSNGDRSGDTRPLWITGLSPPDSWRSLRQPGYLQLDQVRTPKTLRLGVRPHAQSEKFPIDKSGKFSVVIDMPIRFTPTPTRDRARMGANRI